jgi:hypothetical protein
MSQVGKWEGEQFVIGNEFTKDGKEISLKEVWSEITPNSFTERFRRRTRQRTKTGRYDSRHESRQRDGHDVPAVSPKGATPAGTATPNPK